MDRTWVTNGLKVAEIRDVDVPSLLVQRVARLRAKKTLVQGLLKQHFSSHRFEQYVKSVQTETAVPHISSAQIREFPLPLPPLPEQKKIAEILSTWDRAIETTEKLLANAEAQKSALMQQLLTGKRRLKGFEGEWAALRLQDLATITMGSSPPSSSYNFEGEGLPLLQGNADIRNKRSAPRVSTSQPTQRCQIGDTLISVRAPVGAVALSIHNACIGRGLSSVRAKGEFDQQWIYQYLSWFEPRWVRLSQGSTFEAIGGKDLRALEISAPTNSRERFAVAEVLETSDRITETISNQLDALRSEKRALMQQLLTGKRRVAV